MKFYPTSNINENTSIYLKRYILESNYFMFNRLFSKRKNRLKITTKSTTYMYDKVRNDYFLNIRYGLKTFFNINTGIVGALTKEFRKFPLNSTSLYQRRAKDLAIYQKHLLYRSNLDFRYRNLTLKLKPLKHQIYLLSARLMTRPLNKYLYFDLYNKIQSITFQNSVFVLCKVWKQNLLHIFYLGFVFSLKNNAVAKNQSFLKKRTHRHKLAKKHLRKKLRKNFFKIIRKFKIRYTFKNKYKVKKYKRYVYLSKIRGLKLLSKLKKTPKFYSVALNYKKKVKLPKRVIKSLKYRSKGKKSKRSIVIKVRKWNLKTKFLLKGVKKKSKSSKKRKNLKGVPAIKNKEKMPKTPKMILTVRLLKTLKTKKQRVKFLRKKHKRLNKKLYKKHKIKYKRNIKKIYKTYKLKSIVKKLKRRRRLSTLSSKFWRLRNPKKKKKTFLPRTVRLKLYAFVNLLVHKKKLKKI